MGRRAGWTDRARIILDSVDITDTLGIIRGADHDITKGGLENRGGVNYGVTGAYIAEGIREYNHSLTVHSDSFAPLVLVGETSGTELVPADELPSFDFRQQADDSNYITITGAKAGSCTISYEAGDHFEIAFDGLGLGKTETAGLLAKLTYDGKPISASKVVFKVDNVAVGGIQSLNLSLSRELQARGEAGSDSEDPVYIASGIVNVSLTQLVLDVKDMDSWDWASDEESHELKIELPNGETLVIDGFVFGTNDPDEQDAERPAHTTTLTGEGLGWKITTFGGA